MTPIEQLVRWQGHRIGWDNVPDAIQDVELLRLEEPDMPLQRLVNRVVQRYYRERNRKHRYHRPETDLTEANIRDWIATLGPLDARVARDLADGYTVKEIAERLRCSLASVRSARERLKDAASRL